MTRLALELLVILGLALVNAFFAGAEVAVLDVRKTRLRELALRGRRSAEVALRLKENPERFLATVQVGITVVGSGAGAFGGAVLEHPVSLLLMRLGLSPDLAEDVAFALVVAFVSSVSIVLGELVPKSLALRHSERITLLVSRPLDVLATVARPIIWSLTAASNVLLRPFRDRTNFTESRLSVEELRQLVGEAAAAGTFDPETGEIAARAIGLARLEASSVMVPERDVVWLSLEASPEDVERTLRALPHARYPVRGAEGYVLAHDVFTQMLDRRLDLRSVLRPIPKFRESAPAVEILRALQSARSEIGLIVDARDAPCGLVSIETLAEKLFGEIVSEHER